MSSRTALITPPIPPRRIASLLSLLLVAFTLNCEAGTMPTTRKSALAGTWYSANPRDLARAIDGHLAQAPALGEIAARPPVAFITPHAGHQWSGDAAAHLYKLLAGAAGETIERVLLIGPSHYQGFTGVSVCPVEAYETPLGSVPVDTDLCEQLLTQPGFQALVEAHSREHCLEIQLPFLQRVLDHEFKIVPLLVSRITPAQAREIASALAPHIDAGTLVIISSDFTHYGRRFGYLPFDENPDENLRRLDLGAIEPILACDPTRLFAYHEETEISVCGIRAIGILLELLGDPRLRTLWGDAPPEGRVLEYYRSADRIGDFDGSVSYAAIAFFRAGDLRPGEALPPMLRGVRPWGSAAPHGAAEFSPAAREFLLNLARLTLQEVLEKRPAPEIDGYPAGISSEQMNQIRGVFVTLTKHGRLRGCIGHIIGREGLAAGVMQNAINAALHDPRFPKVEAAELIDLEIEISVLTPLRPVAGFAEIEVGCHGVLLEKAGLRSVFLPQVAPEQGWDRETMLTHLSRKAGLPGDAWRTGATFQVFEAEVFSEAELTDD